MMELTLCCECVVLHFENRIPLRPDYLQHGAGNRFRKEMDDNKCPMLCIWLNNL